MGCSLEKKLKQDAELVCPKCEVWIDEKDLEQGHCDVCGENLQNQDRYVKLKVALKGLGVVAQKIREIFDSEINLCEEYSRVPGWKARGVTVSQIKEEVLGLLVEGEP